MTDYIKRKDAIREIQKFGVGAQDFEDYTPEQAERFVIGRLQSIPAADVAPVVHGHWEDLSGKPVPWSDRVAHCPAYSAYCSECRQWLVASDEYTVLGNYCPYCGAKMDEEGEE